MSIARTFKVLLFTVAATAVASAGDKVDPAKLKDKLTIEPGKKLVVQFQQSGNALTDPKEVKNPTEKPPTPTFDFRKMGDNLILVTKNPFAQDMQFRALARVKGRKDYFETSIVPVKSGLLGLELWQDPIEELVLFDFKLTDAD